MSGAVKTVQKVAEATPVYAGAKAVTNLVMHGTNPLRDAGGTLGNALGNAKETLVKPLMEGISGGPQDIPSVAAEDPSAVAAADKKAQAAAKRQTQIDILTKKPGRGGTILTDNYQYQV